MYSYNISKVADNKAFNDVCKALEMSDERLIKEKPLIDVDGSIIQIYTKGNKKIKVSNDYEVDAVYIDSEVDLEGIIKAS